MKYFKRIMLWLFTCLLIFATVAVGIGFYISAPGYKGKESDHFNGNIFLNPKGVKSKGFIDIIKWSTNRKQGQWTENLDPEYLYVAEHTDTAKLAITFVNHSTFLIQTPDKNILTDPVWSERVSPFTFIGPRRMRPPGVHIEDLPHIDIVLISHNHYDHLDIPTLKKLQKAYHPLFIVPLGVKPFMDQKVGGACIEMDWWDDHQLDRISIACVPAQHFSGRGLADRNTTLWAGYVIESDWGNIYFAGDTGYGDFFKEIARKYPIKLSLLPIGAYMPQWFMSPIHTSPEEAVQIHMDMQSPQSIGIHYGTFPLADDGQQEPLSDLQKAKKKHGIPDDAFIILKEGKTKYF